MRSTAEVGPFKILSESSVGQGVRRIEAVTSGAALELLRERERAVGRGWRATCSTEPEAVAEAVDKLRERVRELEKSKGAGAPGGGVDLAALVSQADKHDGIAVLALSQGDTPPDDLLELSDRLRGALGPSVVVLASSADGRAHLVASATPEAVGQGRRRRRRDPRDLAARRRWRRRTSGHGARRRQGPVAHRRGARRGALVPRLPPRVKVLALDYGSARTGVAVSDETGTLATPAADHRACRQRGGYGGPARYRGGRAPGSDRGRSAAHALRASGGARPAPRSPSRAVCGARVEVPIELEDERYTTTIAQRTSRSAASGLDARAAAVLLQGVLDRRAGRC